MAYDYDVLTRPKTVRVEVWHDNSGYDLYDFLGEGAIFFQGSHRYNHYNPDFDPEDYDENIVIVPLDVYEHGEVLYSPSSPNPGYPFTCPFDTARGGAVLLLDKNVFGSLDSSDEVHKLASSICETITAWANGWIFGFAVEETNGELIEAIGGFLFTDSVGDEYMKEEILHAIGNREIGSMNDLAEEILI